MGSTGLLSFFWFALVEILDNLTFSCFIKKKRANTFWLEAVSGHEFGKQVVPFQNEGRLRFEMIVDDGAYGGQHHPPDRDMEV
jgi:hypothetical protein